MRGVGSLLLTTNRQFFIFVESCYPNAMTQRSEGFARLDALIAEHGEGWLLSAFVSRIAEGESPSAVSVSMGMPWFVLRKWLEDKPERMLQMELGKRCFADGLIWESLAAARDADIETLGVSKLQADHFSKMAGRLSRDEWGDRVQMDVKTTHTVDIKALLEAREARLMSVTPPAHLPVMVEQVQVSGDCI